MRKVMSRRNFFRLAGGMAAVTAGAALAPSLAGQRGLQADKIIATLCGGETAEWFKTASAQDVLAAQTPPDLHFGGTDGWIYLPPTPAIPPFHPDNLAPSPFNTYMFGFTNLTGLVDTNAIAAQKMKAQHSAPLFWVQENVPFRLRLSNLGLQMRPDLTDAHTVHWHGFRHVIPFFDGEPMGSVSVPMGRDFTYVYIGRNPGTYMFHCHVEDIEHVHMGMNGQVFVRPAQDGTAFEYPAGSGKLYSRFAYNDGDGSTGFDREFAMHLSEVWAEAHWDDSHIQLPEWTDYKVDFALLNGRVYPDTLAPNGAIDPLNPARDGNGDIAAPSGRPELQYQPMSSLVNCMEGERVLLRFTNLGFAEAAMTFAGLRVHVVGRDATHLKGQDSTDNRYLASTISIAAGESVDAIFTAPAYRGAGPYDTYLLYNRQNTRVNNLGTGGNGGQMTEIRVHPAAAGLPPQTLPNT